MKIFDLALQSKPVWMHLKVERFSAESCSAQKLLCVKIKLSAESDINCSAWQVSTEKVSTISAESDINYSEQNCKCWTYHLTLQSQTDSDTNFFIRVLSTNLLINETKSPRRTSWSKTRNLTSFIYPLYS